MRLLIALLLIALPATAQVRGVASVEYGDYSQLGYSSSLYGAGAGIEWRTPVSEVALDGTWTPSEKNGEGATSLSAHGQALARLGALLVGAGVSASGLSTDSYDKSGTRWTGLLGADLAVGPGTLRLLASYTGPIRDENRLRGPGASWRYETPLSSRASLRGGMGVNWWTVSEPWGETDRVTWLSTLGVTFGGAR